jgi:hypothetical protein
MALRSAVSRWGKPDDLGLEAAEQHQQVGFQVGLRRSAGLPRKTTTKASPIFWRIEFTMARMVSRW